MDGLVNLGAQWAIVFEDQPADMGKLLGDEAKK